MVVFPHAKINLGLQILHKREDGFHDLATCFYPVGICDVLEILPAETIGMTTTGLPIPGDTKDNLCLKAYTMLSEEYDLPPVSIHLHKVIPMGAGLGGGSSDAAFMLTTLNQLFKLSLTPEQLQHYAGRLGSDCPFFIEGRPVLASGTGTELRPVDLSLSGYTVVIIHPGVHVDTSRAYAGVTPQLPNDTLEDLIHLNLSQWQGRILNDFEPTIFETYPETREALHLLIKTGALYASLSGSGAAVFGIFSQDIPPLILPSGWTSFIVSG